MTKVSYFERPSNPSPRSNVLSFDSAVRLQTKRWVNYDLVLSSETLQRTVDVYLFGDEAFLSDSEPSAAA
jgi:hypothetical protein